MKGEIRALNKNYNICKEEKRKIGTKQKDAVTLLLRLTKSFASFQCELEVSGREKLREISTNTFSDIRQNAEQYHFFDSLEPCNNLNEHTSQKSLSGIEDDSIAMISLFYILDAEIVPQCGRSLLRQTGSDLPPLKQ